MNKIFFSYLKILPLLSILASSTFISCSKPTSQAKSQLTISFPSTQALTSPDFAGGLYITGHKTDDTASFAKGLFNQTASDFSTTLDSGEWEFIVFAWDGLGSTPTIITSMTGITICDYKKIFLDPSTDNFLDFYMNSTKCNDISIKGIQGSNQLIKIPNYNGVAYNTPNNSVATNSFTIKKIVFCNSFDYTNNVCTYSPNYPASIRSFKLVLEGEARNSTTTSTTTLPITSLVAGITQTHPDGCNIIDTAAMANLNTNTNSSLGDISLPVSNILNLKVETYPNTSCTGTPTSFRINNNNTNPYDNILYIPPTTAAPNTLFAIEPQVAAAQIIYQDVSQNVPTLLTNYFPAEDFSAAHYTNFLSTNLTSGNTQVLTLTNQSYYVYLPTTNGYIDTANSYAICPRITPTATATYLDFKITRTQDVFGSISKILRCSYPANITYTASTGSPMSIITGTLTGNNIINPLILNTVPRSTNIVNSLAATTGSGQYIITANKFIPIEDDPVSISPSTSLTPVTTAPTIVNVSAGGPSFTCGTPLAVGAKPIQKYKVDIYDLSNQSMATLFISCVY